MFAKEYGWHQWEVDQYSYRRVLLYLQDMNKRIIEQNKQISSHNKEETIDGKRVIDIRKLGNEQAYYELKKIGL